MLFWDWEEELGPQFLVLKLYLLLLMTPSLICNVQSIKTGRTTLILL